MKKDIDLSKWLSVLGIDDNSNPEVDNALNLIFEVTNMCIGEKECLCASFLHGPLHDGDIPAASFRNMLIESGFIAKVVVKGVDGYNACTQKGARAYPLICAGL